jgi:hypothetical protein
MTETSTNTMTLDKNSYSNDEEIKASGKVIGMIKTGPYISIYVYEPDGTLYRKGTV